MFAQLGTVIFQRLESPHSWATEYEWTWADLPRLNARPASQGISPELETHDIGILIASSFADVQRSIDALVEIGDAMQPVPFYLGNGKFVGFVTMRKMGIERRDVAPDGTLNAVEITLELVEYARTKPAKGEAKWN